MLQIANVRFFKLFLGAITTVHCCVVLKRCSAHLSCKTILASNYLKVHCKNFIDTILFDKEIRSTYEKHGHFRAEFTVGQQSVETIRPHSLTECKATQQDAKCVAHHYSCQASVKQPASYTITWNSMYNLKKNVDTTGYYYHIYTYIYTQYILHCELRNLASFIPLQLLCLCPRHLVALSRGPQCIIDDSLLLLLLLRCTGLECHLECRCCRLARGRWRKLGCETCRLISGLVRCRRSITVAANRLDVGFIGRCVAASTFHSDAAAESKEFWCNWQADDDIHHRRNRRDDSQRVLIGHFQLEVVNLTCKFETSETILQCNTFIRSFSFFKLIKLFL